MCVAMEAQLQLQIIMFVIILNNYQNIQLLKQTLKVLILILI